MRVLMCVLVHVPHIVERHLLKRYLLAVDISAVCHVLMVVMTAHVQFIARRYALMRVVKRALMYVQHVAHQLVVLLVVHRILGMYAVTIVPKPHVILGVF